MLVTQIMTNKALKCIIIDFSLHLSLTRPLLLLIETLLNFVRCARSASDQDQRLVRSGSSCLDNRHRALKCVWIVSSSSVSFIYYHRVTTGTYWRCRRSPTAHKIHPNGTFPNVPALVGRISREPLVRFWICKLHWKGIFKGLKVRALRFLIWCRTNELQPI